MKKTLTIAFMALSIISCKQKNTEQSITESSSEVTISNERIVSLNGAVSEILVALGQQNQIVGVDVTSTYPADLAKTATQLEHVNKINIEALLALKPTIVYVLKKELNENLEKQLTDAGIKLIVIDQDYSIDGAKKLIEEVATPLQIQDYNKLYSKIDNDLEKIIPLKTKPKVLFIYARGAGNLFVAGTDTPIQSIIELAGGENAVKGFSDFKPLTPEAILTSNPDYILLFDTGLQSLGGINGVLNIEGIKQTTAGKNNKIISMDGLLLTGFTPRVGEAILELNEKISK